MERVRVKVTFKSTTKANGDMLEIKTGTGALKRWSAGAQTVEHLSHQRKAFDPLTAKCGSIT